MVVTPPSTIMPSPTGDNYSAKKVHLGAHLTPAWPWPLTFWSQNLKRSSLPRSPLVVKVWSKSVKITQDNVLTMFVRDARTHAWHAENNGSGHYVDEEIKTLTARLKKHSRDSGVQHVSLLFQSSVCSKRVMSFRLLPQIIELNKVVHRPRLDLHQHIHIQFDPFSYE